MTTHLHERIDGKLIEYRRHPYDPGILHLEGRVLRPDGTPYDGRWFRVTDAELLFLGRQETDILERLSDEPD